MNGKTGLVKFDESGHRKDFRLNVLELNINNDPRQVLWHVLEGDLKYFILISKFNRQLAYAIN